MVTDDKATTSGAPPAILALCQALHVYHLISSLQQKPVKPLVLCPFYRCTNLGSNKLSTWPKVPLLDVAEKGFEATIPYFVICELLHSTASPSTSHSDGEHDMGMLYEPTALDPA